MRGPSVLLSDDDDDDVIDLSNDSGFKIPSAANIGFDGIVNKKKVSPEVMSLSSASSDVSESDAGDIRQNFYVNKQSSGAESASSENSSESSDSGDLSHSDNNPTMNSYQNQKMKMEAELKEKREIIYQMERLEAKGYHLPNKFNMQSNIDEMRAEYHRIIREKEVDASIKFQRKMLMAMVTGIEFLNTRFDPFDVKLDGWSEQVHENVNDYDEIFEELHDKYKGSGKKMAPELRLLMSLSGSAFMFHLTNSMFKAEKTKLPGVEEVLRSNPDLMKQFQSAAANKVAQNSAAAYPQATRSNDYGAARGPGGNLFSMVGNMFGSSSQQAPSQIPQERSIRTEIDSVINDINAEIKQTSTGGNTQQRNIETMSITDDEITSIIEDTADLNGIMMGTGGTPKRTTKQRTNGKRTLNI